MYVSDVPAGHALLTPTFGNTCPINATPYISHCTVSKKSYDQPGALLNFVYGKQKAPAKRLSGQIVAFNQREFADSSTAMAEDAYVYIPAACAQGTSCKVHVALHGCLQSAAVVNDNFYKKTSCNAWADSNNIVVLYPQVNATVVPYNPGGCWDWYGYTGPNFAWKSGPQIVAITAMIDRLTSKP